MLKAVVPALMCGMGGAVCMIGLQLCAVKIQRVHRLCVLLVSSLHGPKDFVDNDMFDSAWCTVCVDYSISASKRCLARQSLSRTDLAEIG